MKRDFLIHRPVNLRKGALLLLLVTTMISTLTAQPLQESPDEVIQNFRTIRSLTFNATLKGVGALRGRSVDFDGRFSLQKQDFRLLKFRSITILDVADIHTSVEETIYNGKTFYLNNFDEGRFENKGELYMEYRGETKTRTSAMLYSTLVEWYQELAENSSRAIIESSVDGYAIKLPPTSKRGELVMKFLKDDQLPFMVRVQSLTGTIDDYKEMTINSVRTDVKFAPYFFEVPENAIHENTSAPITAPSLLLTGIPAPQWELRNSDGELKKLSDYYGKIVILDFWATWCGPCVKAMPLMQSIHEKYPDVAVLGMNHTEKVDINKFKEKKKLGYEMILADQKTIKDYKVNALPTLYILDRLGNIIYAGAGYNGDDSELLGMIENALR